MTDALGFVLNGDVFSCDPFPPFRASIKDGYAVIGNDIDECWLAFALVDNYNYNVVNLLICCSIGLSTAVLARLSC